MTTPTGSTPVMAPMAGPPRFGIMASIPMHNDYPRWSTGIKYMPEGCNNGQSFDICDPYDKEDRGMPEEVDWKPFAITVTETCSAFGMSFEERQERVRRLIQSDTERQLGAELWDGAIAQQTPDSPNTWLAKSTEPEFVDLTGVSPAGYVRAIACLEQFLAENNGGQQGVIHATAQLVTVWESFRLLRREGNKILTFKDTLVIPSPGYSGNDPEGTTGSDNIWAYATDMPRWVVGDVQGPFDIEESMDRAENTIDVTASRLALIEWERCRHAGIQVLLSPCGTY